MTRHAGVAAVWWVAVRRKVWCVVRQGGKKYGLHYTAHTAFHSLFIVTKILYAVYMYKRNRRRVARRDEDCVEERKVDKRASSRYFSRRPAPRGARHFLLYAAYL